MISPITPTTLAIHRRNILALCSCCCLLLLPNLPTNAHGYRAPTTANRHQYQQAAGDSSLMMSPFLGSGQLDQMTGGDSQLFESADASLVADLLGSFSERQTFAPDTIERPLQSQPQPQRQQRQRQPQETPGHYEFEVAPKMEPPGAPRPPFKQANSVCPGSGKQTGARRPNSAPGSGSD